MYSYMVTNFNYIAHVITFYPPIAIVHYGIYYNSYANQTINNYVDQNNKYDIVLITYYHGYYFGQHNYQ